MFQYMYTVYESLASKNVSAMDNQIKIQENISYNSELTGPDTILKVSNEWGVTNTLWTRSNLNIFPIH